ncbi:MAG: YybH family protein [Acidimicrobiales bacterium]
MATADDVFTSVRDWMAAWGREVAAADLDAGRARFAADVIGFGTRARVARGLDSLFTEQWSQVWPAIEDFAFRLAELDVLASPDGRLAVAVCEWDSTGVDSAGSRFPRPGRATVVLRRADPSAPWQAVHTHFSIAGGAPAESYGAGAAGH